MRRFVALVATTLVVGACNDRQEATGPITLQVRTATTHLLGENEVPARETPAVGQAVIHVNHDTTEIRYVLNVTNIENVVASHIHVGAAGTNGPVVAFLYGNVPPGGGRVNGRLASGAITAANLVGPMLGASLQDLVAAMTAGNTYVNVHTNDGVAPTNTGAGDFPGGEVRGQLLTGSLF
jgi:hypothetical protein